MLWILFYGVHILIETSIYIKKKKNAGREKVNGCVVHVTKATKVLKL